jgi:2-polyprenyl-3-methyl-5-hydroxy-6-metoxy-1,4-benzoquinol methylase
LTETAYEDLQRAVGSTDIYLLDQILKGRIVPEHRVLDVGAGGGRNLRWPLHAGCDVWAVDRQEEPLRNVRMLADELGVALPADRLQVAELPDLPWESAWFDVVLCIAVLHFAPHHERFNAMTRELWRVLKPGGMLFVRTASVVGLDPSVVRDANGRAHLPDGSDRYLVTPTQLQELTLELGASMLDPIKTVVVHQQRAMTTWCVRRETT